MINSLTNETWPKPYITLLSRQLKVLNICRVKVARGDHILPNKSAQAVLNMLNMDVDKGETVHTLDEVSRGKDAHPKRETISRPGTARGKLSVYRLEVITERLQPKLVKTLASRQLLLHNA